MYVELKEWIINDKNELAHNERKQWYNKMTV